MAGKLNPAPSKQLATSLVVSHLCTGDSYILCKVLERSCMRNKQIKDIKPQTQ